MEKFGLRLFFLALIVGGGQVLVMHAKGLGGAALFMAATTAISPFIVWKIGQLVDLSGYRESMSGPEAMGRKITRIGYWLIIVCLGLCVLAGLGQVDMLFAFFVLAWIVLCILHVPLAVWFWGMRRSGAFPPAPQSSLWARAAVWFGRLGVFLISLSCLAVIVFTSVSPAILLLFAFGACFGAIWQGADVLRAYPRSGSTD